MLARDERGQAVPLALVVVALAILATAAIAELGGNVVDAGRARTAADAAALAGVEGGRGASASVAADNGAAVVSWSSQSDGAAVTVTVTVRVGRRDGDGSRHESGTMNAVPCPGGGGSAAYTRCHGQHRPPRRHRAGGRGRPGLAAGRGQR